MEVHAHAHSSPDKGGTARKKWTHYFWEFLMLFLAVFCGFLAEYQLEHKIEKDREKQYIRSFEEDLDNDILDLDGQISLCQIYGNAADSLTYCSNTHKRKNLPEIFIIFFVLFIAVAPLQ